MAINKHEFGRFVTERRRQSLLTQRQLAEQLHVTESAVSKWERGLSYPDITLVAPLAAALGVTSPELISASEDRLTRLDQRDARTYRRWRGGVLWSTLALYAVTILTCGIVNLSVDHTLTWFWMVLPAVLLAFCLTTLPLLRVPRPGWSALGGSVLSLVALLLAVWGSAGGGAWLPITLAAILFALVAVFGPIWLALLELPRPLAGHRTVWALALDTVALVGMLLIICIALGHVEWWAALMLPLAAIGLAPIWTSALVVRYLPVNGWGRASLVAVVLAVTAAVVQPLVDAVLGAPARSGSVDLSRWNEHTINANVMLLVIGCLLVAGAVLGAIAARRTWTQRRAGRVQTRRRTA